MMRQNIEIKRLYKYDIAFINSLTDTDKQKYT